jgi:hypothetical protein
MASIERNLNVSFVLPSGRHIPVEVGLVYHEGDPFGVRLNFHVGESGCGWVLSRDLLIKGLSRRAGVGDVRIWPVRRQGERRLRILLDTPAGEALVDAPAAAVADFLDQTLALVAKGRERVDVDALIARLLSPEARPR